MQTEWMARTASDVRRLADCFARNDLPKDLEALDWQYLRNPAGGPIAAFAVDTDPGTAGTVGAIYAVFPVRFTVGGREVLGAQSLDTLTDAAYRGRGLFVSQAREVYGRCRADGVALVYGFPNGNSAPGFFSKLGWRSLDPVPFLIKPLRSRYFLARVPKLGRALARLPDVELRNPFTGRPGAGGLAVEPIRRFDAATDAVWRDYVASCGIAVVRDSTYLNWRFFDRPGEGYEVFGCRDASGRLRAFAALAIRVKHGGRIAYLMELLHDDGGEQAAAACLGHAVDRARAERCDALLAWNLEHSRNNPLLRAIGFVNMPERIRPIELHFGALPLVGASGDSILDRKSWYLSYCDSDTV